MTRETSPPAEPAVETKPKPNHSMEWRLSDEMNFLREIKKLRARGLTFRQNPPKLPAFADFCEAYLQGLELRARGWKRNSEMDEEDRARIHAHVLRLLQPPQEVA